MELQGDLFIPKVNEIPALSTGLFHTYRKVKLKFEANKYTYPSNNIEPGYF